MSKRFDPDLKYVGSGSYVPVMVEIAGGEYVLEEDYSELRDVHKEALSTIVRLEQERDAALAKADAYERDWREAKSEYVRDQEGTMSDLESTVQTAKAEGGVAHALDVLTASVKAGFAQTDANVEILRANLGALAKEHTALIEGHNALIAVYEKARLAIEAARKAIAE